MDTIISSRRRQLVGALGGLGALALAGCSERSASTTSRSLVQLAGETMGTTYTVKLAGPGVTRERGGELLAAVQAAFDSVEQRMSLYRADSELVRFNRQRGAVPFPMSEDLFGVFNAAQQVSELSGGAFDITVAPLVDAWGFGPDKHRIVPQPAALSARRRVVGYRALQFDAARRAVTKTRAELQADLNGIAKGYGVDLAARALDERGVANYMIEAGGEVRTHGVNATGQPWQIGIERPDATPRRAHLIVPLAGQAMATSGDYRIYFEQGGRRYSHEIDPTTGVPIDHRLCSVTVVADDGMRADALATALIVLGPDRGHALAQARGIAAYFILREADGRLSELSSAAFAALGGRHA